MFRLITIIMLLFLIQTTHGQQISRHEADSLLKSLNKASTVNNRINTLLKLAEFQVLKPGELKADFDSAENYLNKAAILNATAKSREASGYQNLILSKLNREKKILTDGKNFAESAVKMLKEERNKYLLGDAYFELSQYYDYSDPTQIVEKIRIVELAIQQFQQAGNVERLAYTLQFAADLYQVNNEDSKALEKLNLSLKAYESINYSQLQNVYILFGDLYKKKADYGQALTYHFLALKAAENVHDTSAQLCQIYNRIGSIYLLMDEKKKAIQYLKSALEIAERLNNNSDVLTIVFNIMSAYNKLDPVEALAFLKGIPKKYLVTDNPGLDFVVPMLYLSAYISLNQYDEGKPYTDQLINLLDRHKSDKGTLSNFYKLLGSYYLGAKEYTDARTYLLKNYELLLTMKDPYRMSLNYRWLFKLDSTEGNYKSAIENLLAYNKLHDSIYNESKSRQIKEIGIQYETEKKEQELKLKDNAIRLNEQDILLLTKQSELQQKDFYQSRLRFEFDSSSKEQSLKLLNLEAARKDNDLRFKQQDISLLKKESLIQQIKLKETKTIRNFIVVGAIMLLLLLGLGYNRYRLKIQVNKELKAKQREINKNNESLQHLLTEKEWLLKEVHHRVKNNLHTVICLLESQAAYLENDALKANENTQHRIYAMSLIHQKLYKSDDIKTIDMSSYLPEFIDYLRDSFDIEQQIHFNLKIESLKLGVSQAIPIALILNEAVTNSIKYAFPLNRKGSIDISMQQYGNHIRLWIADNGIGIDSAIAELGLSSMGLKLIRGLSEDIDATINFKNDHGTKITIDFDLDPLNGNESAFISPKEVEPLYEN